MQTTSSTLSDAPSIELGSLAPGRVLPLLVSAKRPGQGILEAFSEISACAERHLYECGALLFRDFAIDGVPAFRSFAGAFGHPLLSYEFGSTPRRQVDEGVYTSTEYPAHQAIPLHNEQSYCRDWPMKIWFYCALAAPEGGETPIADSREAYRRIDPAVRQRLTDRGLMYVRNYGNGLDVPWEQVFNTTERSAVEQYCAAHGISAEWKSDGELRTRQICQAVAQHPKTGARVWFNQAHLFHVSNLQPDVREALLAVVGADDLPRNVYYGDGAAIEDSVLDEIRGVLGTLEVRFPRRSGDVLMLDNMLTAHARAPFQGPRKVVVAMAEAFTR